MPDVTGLGGVVLDLVVSVDAVATELQLAAADVAIEQQLPAPPTSRQVEAIPALTDDLVTGDDAPLPNALAAGLGTEEQVAILSEVKDKVSEIWRDFNDWRRNIFSTAADKLKAIAEKVIKTAQELGVSAEHLIGRLQRRITSALVQNAVLPPFQVGRTDDELATFAASEVTVTSTVRSSPSLGSVDLSGVVKLLTGILSLELEVEVKYGAKLC
jgi:hypothetical protein